MNEQDQSQIIAGHEYDGIQEYDNPTPGWWTWLFIATFIFSIFYYAYYELGTGPTIISLYEEAKANDYPFGDLSDDSASLMSYMDNAELMAYIQSEYQTKCSACHGPNGEGTTAGPNMTDNHYKNVKSIEEIPNVIRNGANNVMPAWRGLISENNIIALSAYVASMRGKNLTGPREAEGEEIPPWPK